MRRALLIGVTNQRYVQVEMFGVTADESGEESAQMLQEFVSLQKEIFSSLELHFRLFYFINFVVWCVCENTSRHASPFCVLLILQSP